MPNDGKLSSVVDGSETHRDQLSAHLLRFHEPQRLDRVDFGAVDAQRAAHEVAVALDHVCKGSQRNMNKVLLGFIGFYLVLPGFTGFLLVLTSFIVFYCFFLAFTGLYWVLPGFTGFF